MHNSDIQLYDTVVTRFTNDTWNQNRMWREKNGLSNGCIYNAVGPLLISIGQTPNVFVVEMNNEQNDIIGIGLIKNRLCLKKHEVYRENRYNYFTYKSNYRISSRLFDELFTDTELVQIDNLRKYLFTGYSHLKRGTGYSKLPEKIVYKPGKKIAEYEIENVYTILFMSAFKRHYKTIAKDDLNRC